MGSYARFLSVVAIISLVCCAGCMRQVKRNLEETSKAGAIIGTITDAGADPKKVVVVALMRSDTGVKAFNYTNLKSSGRFVLRVELPGAYDVAAFIDTNGNLRPDPGEPVRMCAEDALFRDDMATASVECSLAGGGSIPDPVRDALASVASLERKPLPIKVGEVADLSDPRFSAEFGEKGLWEFFDFLVNGGIGVYFLEPYDPDRTPVLFVNGAGGSPQDWRYFFEHLDRSRYQAWFYFYPSGAALDGSADTLNRIIGTLRERYGFRRLYVTAHSMGGLVARGFINRAVVEGKADFVKLFVSLSTPWNGHAAARYGVEIAPATIPSWIDMVPGSDYQKGLFSDPLDNRVAYYLLFGYRGDTALFSDNNDGTVALSSMLHPPAQREARKVYGFNEDHLSILSSAELFEVYQAILDNAD